MAMGSGWLMAKITFYGLAEYEKKLQNLSVNIERIENEAIYLAAKEVADGIKAGINSLNPGSSSGKETEAEYKRRVKQKEGLSESFGISPMQNDNGFRNVKLGFDGYNSVRTPQYPSGQPNVMVARVFNSGTSFSNKQPFFDNAIRATKNKAKKIMKDTVESAIEQEMKE